MSRAIDVERAIEVIEAKQKELCPVGMYGRNYVYGSDREKYDAWEEIIDALNNLPTLTPQNEPLTIEQLREMDGQPVWIKQLKDLSVCDTGWALIDICPDREEKLYDIRVWWPGSEVEDEPSEENYGKTWVAYDRPPERQEDNNETD